MVTPKIRRRRRRARVRQVAACLLSVCVVVGVGSYLWPFLRMALAVSEPSATPSEQARVSELMMFPKRTGSTIEPPLPMADALLAKAVWPAPVAAALPPSSMRLINDRVTKGQTLVALFAQAGLETTQAVVLYKAVERVYNLRHLRVGQPYQIEVSPDGQVQSFTYDIRPGHQLHVQRQQQQFVGRIVSLPYDRNERVVTGRVENSIYAALSAQGESPRLIHDFAEIFSWSIDFETDLRQGDTYRLLIEERSRHGDPPHYHRILAAELVNRNRTLRTVYYEDDAIGGYYQPDGRSMQGMFLRSPLRYTRVSSRFSHRRLHPILKRYQPHLGVDYAAPLGTPVRSVAAGTVTWLGRKGPNGKMIQIRHNAIYTTSYLHLSRYAGGIQRGSRVQQGQLIGYVGSTGRSTGPHLDFRLSKNGTFINPLTHEALEAPPVPKRVLSGFRTYAQDQLAKLEAGTLGIQQAASKPNAP